MTSMGEVRVIESDSLWDRFKVAFSKPKYIITVVIVVLLLITVISLVVIFTGNGDSSNAVIDFSKALIVSDERDLYALDLNSQKQTVLKRTSKGIACFDYYKRNTIFWRASDSQWVNSLSKKYYNYTQTREWDPTAIAVDYVTGNIYVLDKYAGKLNIFDMQSMDFGVAVTDLNNPIDIVLDPSRGVMFIAQKYDSILKGNMDGTSFEKIVTNGGLSAIAVDPQTTKLYWSDSVNIASCDYSGNKGVTVTRISGEVTSLGVSGNRLFWTKFDQTANIRSLWSCTMVNGICDAVDFVKIPFDDPKSIKVYTEELPSIENPCENAKGGCKHLCLLTTNDGYKCACYIGYRLDDDAKSCTPVNDYLLYTRGHFIKGRILDSNIESFHDAILPIRVQSVVVDRKKTIDFDYNYYTNTVAFSDDQTINTINLKNNDRQGTYNRDGCLKDISFDWVSNDIYYLKDNCFTTPNKTSIVVLKPREESYFWKTLDSFDYYTGHPRALVLHPNRGCYFFTVLLNGVARIFKKYGLKLSIFSNDYLSVNETALAIDYEEDKLYWFNQNLSLLQNANLDGTDVKRMDISFIQEPRSLSIHERYVYVSNLTSIWRLDKLTGRGSVKMVPRFDDGGRQMIGGVKIFGQKAQRIDPENPCSIKNGECQQFCFRAPKFITSKPNKVNDTGELQKICLCDDFREIQTDGMSCV